MKPKEVRELNEEELEQKLKDSKVELFNLRFRLTTGQLDNALKVRWVKKDIARIFTVKRERELNPVAQKPKTETQKSKKSSSVVKSKQAKEPKEPKSKQPKQLKEPQSKQPKEST